MDDIGMAAKTVDEHLEILGNLLDCNSENNLKINNRKCAFLRNECKFLGNSVSKYLITPSE